VGSIKLDLGDTGWGGIEYTDLPLDRNRLRTLLKAVINTSISQNVENVLSSYTTGGF
jgi:hypothetical protein